MKANHLSSWEQEEYLLNERTPQMLRHLAECPECRDAVAHLQQTIGMFRSAAVEYSALSLATHPQQALATDRRPAAFFSLRWAFAGLVPLLLLVLALLPLHISTPMKVHPAAPISDDALLEQVDEQLSVAVPSSMELLTHLVSADSRNAGQPGARSSIVQSN